MPVALTPRAAAFRRGGAHSRGHRRVVGGGGLLWPGRRRSRAWWAAHAELPDLWPGP